jgi:pyrimidine 5'-nucleotidase
MHFTALFFDLDDTLYPSNTGLWNAIRDRMGLYMHEKIGIPWEDIPRLRIQFFEKFGTTLRGLQHYYTVDTEEYLAFVHDLPLDQYLVPEPAVRSLLKGLPQPKWVFTNADAAHAGRVLKVLDLSDCFQGVIDIHKLNFACKPEKVTYLRALELAEQEDPRTCLLVEDAIRNLAPAHALGFTTVLIHNHASFSAKLQDPIVDYAITHLSELRQAIPSLWDER